MKKSSTLRITVRGQYREIPAEQIRFCKAQSNYTEIYLKDDSQCLVSKTLSAIQDLLPDNLFCRCHNSYLVNRKSIKSFDPKENKIVLNNSLKISVSQRKLAEITAWILE